MARSNVGPVTGVVSAVLGIAALIWYRRVFGPRARDATSTDPGLLVKGTTFQCYETPSGYVYPKIRTFFHQHPKAKELPSDLPLIVFIHGLGGSAAQFASLLTSMVNIAPCLAIDLPGCGRSEFAPLEDEAYTTLAFAELLYVAIDRHRNSAVDQKVILVGHSMGCSIAALLSSSTSPLATLCSQHIVGFFAICPRSTAPTDENLRTIERLQWIWSPLFDLMRMYDRAGGVNSTSVLRVVGKDADYETRRLQLRFNQQSSSAVFQKVLKGVYIQEMAAKQKNEKSLLGKRTWSGVKMPLFLVAADDDKLAPPKEAEQISDWLNPLHVPRHDSKASEGGDESIAPDIQPEKPPAIEIEEPVVPAATGDAQYVQEQFANYQSFTPRNSIDDRTNLKDIQIASKHSFVLKTVIFPGPSSHGLLYVHGDVRILRNYIEQFIAKYIDRRVSPIWQLQHLTSSGKWDVKNLKKWQAVAPCSEPIAGIFRVMKTMREVDDVHNPREFVKKFGYKAVPDGVAMVVDISHDVPVYSKEGLEHGGVEYHKFPTVSKQPPTRDEVEQFIGLIDNLRQDKKFTTVPADQPHPTIGLHCHYGFNRSGFIAICYLIEKEQWKVEDAIAEFREKRPPGIKHEHFIDELYVRYAAKIQRRETLVG